MTGPGRPSASPSTAPPELSDADLEWLARDRTEFEPIWGRPELPPELRGRKGIQVIEDSKLQRGLFCRGCGVRIATGTWRTARVNVNSYLPDREITVGSVITLEPGYVDAPRRHPSGARWYRPAASRNTRAFTVQLTAKPPAVVTCRCGRESLLHQVSRETAAYARASQQQRQKLRIEEEDREAEDYEPDPDELELDDLVDGEDDG